MPEVINSKIAIKCCKLCFLTILLLHCGMENFDNDGKKKQIYPDLVLRQFINL